MPASVRVGLSDIIVASQVKILGVTNLTLHQHVTNVCASAYVELSRIASIRQCLSCDATKAPISAFVSSKLDYCNSLLARTPKNLIDKLQMLDAVGDFTSFLFSIPFIGCQYHVGFSTRSHLCVIAPFLKMVPGICQNYCINTHSFGSFAHLLTA